MERREVECGEDSGKRSRRGGRENVGRIEGEGEGGRRESGEEGVRTLGEGVREYATPLFTSPCI